jgi:amino acid permease
VALVTGFAALLMLATAAAGRYDPSMQFLQLLSAMDIAWVTAALFFGARKLWGPRWAWLLGAVIVLACVASIAAYLGAVGFSADGGWIVDARKMWTIVIPSDMAAAVAAIAVLLAAGWPVSQPTEQRSPQS